jgi:hypothetical protein
MVWRSVGETIPSKDFSSSMSFWSEGVYAPSCGAKRTAIFSELLQNRILADVPHAQWVFVSFGIVNPVLAMAFEIILPIENELSEQRDRRAALRRLLVSQRATGIGIVRPSRIHSPPPSRSPPAGINPFRTFGRGLPLRDVA